MNEAFASRLAIRQRLRRVPTLVRRALPFASGLLTALVALLIYHALVPAPPQITANDVHSAITEAMASATPAPAFSSTAFQIIQPSLVFIQTGSTLIPRTNTRYEPGDRYGDMLTSLHLAANEGIGAGVIVNEMGAILTNLHLVAGAGVISLTFFDGTTATGTIVGTQPENDIAVLTASKLPDIFVPATLTNPNAMRVGDEAYAVGSPFALTGSMSAGVISGFERTYQVPGSDLTLQHLIQFDAAVNPGNSGGPLIDRFGQVVGIVTAFLNPSGENVFAGVSFAVPITTAGGAAGAPPV